MLFSLVAKPSSYAFSTNVFAQSSGSQCLLWESKYMGKGLKNQDTVLHCILKELRCARDV